MSTKIEPALIKTSELARHIGISAECLRDWQAAGRHRIPAPALKDRTIVYYNRADALAWVARIKRGELA